MCIFNFLASAMICYVRDSSSKPMVGSDGDLRIALTRPIDFELATGKYKSFKAKTKCYCIDRKRIFDSGLHATDALSDAD
eukprot:6190490-Pleurochrysis_carterae.AAC.2